MRSLLSLYILLALSACSNGGASDGTSCPSLGAAGGNRFANPSFQWSQKSCACSMPLADGGAPGGSCSAPQDCAAICCTCPNGSGWTFTANACMDKACLGQAACQAVLAADSEPCKVPTPQP